MMFRLLILCCFFSLSFCDILRNNIGNNSSGTRQVPHVAASTSDKQRVRPLRIPPAPHRSILIRQSQLPDVQQRVLPLPHSPPPIPPIPPPPVLIHTTHTPSKISPPHTSSKTSPPHVPQNEGHPHQTKTSTKPIAQGHSSPHAADCASIGGVLIHSKHPSINSYMDMYEEMDIIYGINPYHMSQKMKMVCQVELRDETQVATFMMSLRQKMTKFPAFEITIKFKGSEILTGESGKTIGGGNHAAGGTVSGGTSGSGHVIGASGGGNSVASGSGSQRLSVQSEGQLAQLTSRLESVRAVTARQIAELSIRINSIERQLDDLRRRGTGSSNGSSNGGTNTGSNTGDTNGSVGGTGVTVPDLSGFDDP